MQSNHRNWRRLVAAPLTALLAAGMLAACSSSDTPDPDGENGQTGGVEGSAITIGTFSPLAPQYELWAEAYMDEFPERSVEILPVSEDFVQYQQTLATQRISGTMPDLIFNVDFLANTFAQDELVMDIAPFLEEGKDGLSLDNFVPQFVDQYRPLGSEEQVMGLPVSADSTALLWNKTLFDEVGVTEYPTEDWTWEDFIRVATEIQEAGGGNIYGATAPAADGSSVSGWGPVLLASGLKIYDPETNTTDIDSPEALQIWEEYLMPFYGTAGAPLATDPGAPGTNFGAGNVAMGISSSALIAGMREGLGDVEWDITRVPTVNGQHASGGGSYGFSISATSENVDAAWAFLAWFYSEEGGFAVAQTPEGGGIIPPTLEGLEGGGIWSQAEVPANLEVLAQTAQDAFLMVPMPGNTQSALTEAVKTAFQEVQFGGASVEDAFTKAAEVTNAALEEEAGR